ncbi:MAG TPA: acetamidase/formamidase family protein [Pseudolabrys sp.]|nr:acetamidase/formamidase family protein [Pseudolabrys sp.]
MSTHHDLPAQVGTVQWGFYDAAVAPVLTVASGDTVTVNTLSGTPDNLPPDNSGFTLLPEHRAVLDGTPRGPGPHLLTGPIAVEGAVPGDALKIEILDIKLRQDWGYNLILPLLGALPEDFPQARIIHIAIDRARGRIRMPWGLEFAAAPFFGCMGVAPPVGWGRQSSIQPRPFGGNMDNRDLVAGTTLHLPVFHPGGLFSAGDGHAAQGHGEVNVTAVETALTGTFRITLEKGASTGLPWAETPGHLMSMGFDEDLDDAAKQALRAMIALIRQRTDLSAEDAYTLCSVAADLIVTQVVDGNKGIHAMLPLWALSAKG